MMGGLPNQISTLAGFTPSYNFTDPGTSRAMIYAVSPLAQVAPSGTTIAGVDLGGVQTGGGQFNTFLTGSDNLNWMISDFGKFNLPKVEPARLEYMLYPQRVEPETKSLPEPMAGVRNPNLALSSKQGEPGVAVQPVNPAGSKDDILDRNSFNLEDPEEGQESAQGPVVVPDGGKPQAAHQRGRSDHIGEDGTPVTRNGSNNSLYKATLPGPMLRSAPAKTYAKPAESADAERILKEEKERAEVNTAVPVAGSR
jgi:hypothetical protein